MCQDDRGTNAIEQRGRNVAVALHPLAAQSPGEVLPLDPRIQSPPPPTTSRLK
jgi:hypothetical protein